MMRQVLDEYDSRMLCGEVQGKIDRIGHFYGNSKPRLHLPLNFALLDTKWDALSLQAMIDAYFNALPDGAWPDWMIGGHDKQRIASKIGQAQARVLAMLLMTIRGTPFFYMGDELGKPRSRVPSERVDDPFEKLVPGFGLGRDPERTPMRWDESEHGGFTSGEPWLPMLDDRSRNVERQKSDERSILQLYRQLIELRRTNPCLIEGDYEPIRVRNDILSYRRSFGESKVLIGLNIASEPRLWECGAGWVRLISTYLDGDTRPVGRAVLLRANEGMALAWG
jgi:alpha-glucosidase